MSGAVLAKAVMRPFLVIADTSGFLFDFRPWYNKLFGISISTAAAVSSAAGVLWIRPVAHHKRRLCVVVEAHTGWMRCGHSVCGLFHYCFRVGCLLWVRGLLPHTCVFLFWQRAAELHVPALL